MRYVKDNCVIVKDNSSPTPSSMVFFQGQNCNNTIKINNNLSLVAW